MDDKRGPRVVAQNRKAWHDYHILQKYEAGISLLGTEIKSVRAGHLGMRDTYAAFENGELFLHNLSISPYKDRGYAEHEERRKRKLLLTKSELRKLARQVEEKGNTIVPLDLHWKGPYLKVEIAVVKGKREYDKRDSKEAARMDRELKREFKNRSQDKKR